MKKKIEYSTKVEIKERGIMYVDFQYRYHSLLFSMSEKLDNGSFHFWKRDILG